MGAVYLRVYILTLQFDREMKGKRDVVFSNKIASIFGRIASPVAASKG